MDNKTKQVFENKLKKQIEELKKIQTVILLKKPSYEFLDPTINNAIASMVDLLVYLEGKNPYYKGFSPEFFEYRQTAMHREFFANLFLDTEVGIKGTIKHLKLEVSINRKKQANHIVRSIKKNLKSNKPIKKELSQVRKLVSKHPTFNDFLNTLLEGVAGLGKKYKVECRAYFDALNIIRNKISHSNESLTAEEKIKLKKAGFSKTIGKNSFLQMTFEGYSLLLMDVVGFFDKVNANL